jgi:hypothetical protein
MAPVIMSKIFTLPSNNISVSNIEVGSSVYLNVDGVKTEFLVVHQGNPNSSIYDASCDGTWLLMKNIYENHIKDNLKKNIIEDTVKYVEQLHSYKTCNEKHEIAKTNILILLSEKNISITDLELEILLESACNNLKKEKSKITEITNN